MSRKEPARSVREQLAAAVQLFVNRITLFQASIADRLQLLPVDLFALLVLKQGNINEPSELARSLQVPSGTATKIVDRLERRGFVSRGDHAVDRRRVVVRPIPEKVAEIEMLYDDMARHLQSAITGASAAELRFLLKFLRSGSEAAGRNTGGQ